MNLQEKIKSNLSEMTKSERIVATYFLSNQNAFAFETLDSVAEKINISTTSVIRFCRRVGFSGYKDFQDSVRAGFKSNLTLPDKFSRAIETENHDIQFPQIAQNAINCIERTFAEASVGQIQAAIDAITNAKRVFCFGLKESYALAHYAYTRFLTVRSNVFMLSAGHSGEIESVLSLDKDDVCVFFLFHRYTKPAPKILEFLKQRGVTVILITSPPYEELEDNASILLPCYVDVNGIKNSSVAPVCLTDHLCNGVVVASGDKMLDYMKKSEELFKEFTF